MCCPTKVKEVGRFTSFSKQPFVHTSYTSLLGEHILGLDYKNTLYFCFDMLGVGSCLVFYRKYPFFVSLNKIVFPNENLILRGLGSGSRGVAGSHGKSQ